MKPLQIVIALHNKQEPNPGDYQMAKCPVRAKVWPLLQKCWMIDSPPSARCSAKDCRIAFQQEFYDVIQQPRNGELEEALSDSLQRPSRMNGSHPAHN